MTVRTSKLGSCIAFLKRWSQVRILPGMPLFSKDQTTSGASPDARLTRKSGGICTQSVRGRTHSDPLSALSRWGCPS